MIAEQQSATTHDVMRQRIEELGPWFHNLRLNGIETAPHHFLGDYPGIKFRHFRDAIPTDLTGKSVLDIGCNAGFYSFEMKRRGAARVLGIDTDEHYLRQAVSRQKSQAPMLNFDACSSGMSACLESVSI